MNEYERQYLEAWHRMNNRPGAHHRLDRAPAVWFALFWLAAMTAMVLLVL